MRNRLKIFSLLALVTGGIIFASLQFEPVKAATRRVVYGLKFTDGLIGYWSFDGAYLSGTTATDRSGSGNTGTITSGQVVAEGVVGQALNFDGVDDYVSTTNPLTNPQNFSVSFWFKTATASGHKIVGFENAQTGTGGANYDRQIYIGTDGKIYFGWYSGSFNLITSTDALNDDKWHHVVGTHASGGGGVLYVDGVSQGTAANDAESYTGYWRIGSYKLTSWTNASDGYYAGQVDEVRIYNRSLSAAEQFSIYARSKPAGSGTVINMPKNNFMKDGLVGNWSFNGQDMSGVTAIDRGTGGNNGTLTGGPVVTEGVVGQALSLDGVNDYVTIADHATLDIASAITISAWIRHASNTFKDWEAIVTKGDSAYRLHLCGNTSFCGGTPTDDAINATFTGTSCSNNSVTSTVVPALNKWYHVVTTYEGSAIKIYIDGALNAEVGCTGSITTNGFALNVGENAESTGRYWTGDIDEVRLYNRALSAAEVLQLYRAGSR